MVDHTRVPPIDHKQFPQRKDIRAKRYDYNTGAFFITMCSHRHIPMFSEIVESQIRLTSIGTMVDEEWRKTATLREYVKLDEYVIMPNHFHGILWVLPEAPNDKLHILGRVVSQMKAAVTQRASSLINPPIWQRGYYDHIIRNEADLMDIRDYIVNNPLRWELDKYHVRR